MGGQSRTPHRHSILADYRPVVLAHMNKELELFSPAKINLFLAITGLRADGFHELVSLVAPVGFGDTLRIAGLGVASSDDRLESNGQAGPLDEHNLVLRAAKLFRSEVPEAGFFAFQLHKRIPVGAGLGGGSSNAATALLGMNQLSGDPLDFEALVRLAARLGSDCPLFLYGKPVIMRGRGERIETLPVAAEKSLAGQSILIFKPAFSIATNWAYSELKRAKGSLYFSAAEIESSLASWLERPALATLPLLNNMQSVSFKKFLALPVLLEQLRSHFGLECLMSGSGSACFAILPDDAPVSAIEQMIRDSWGQDAFVAQSKLGGTQK